MAISFIGASSTAFPTHAVGDLLIAAVWNQGSLSQPSGWSTAYLNNNLDGSAVGVFYRFATVTNTAIPSLSPSISESYVVYRGATAIGAAAGGIEQFPALTLQDASGLSWVFCSGVASGGMPSSVSGLTRRVVDYPYGASYDTNGGVSSFTAKSVTYANGVSIEIRGDEQKSTAGAVSLAVTPTSVPAKSRSLTNPVVGNVLENVPMNGTFETDVSGWFWTFFGETLCAISRDTTVKRTGTASMRVEARRDLVGSDGVFDSGEVWYQVMNSAAHINGATYRVTAWVYLDASCDQVGLHEFFGSIPGATTTVKGAWTQLVIEGVSVRDPFDINLRGDGVNAVFWVDDVKVERVMEPLDVALTVVGEVVKVYGISGTAAAASTTGGSFSKRSSLSGTVGAVSTTSGDITLIPGSVTYQVTGTVAVISTTAALPNIRAPTTGTVAVVSTTAGNATRLLLTLPVTGTAPVTSATSGALTKRTAASGTSAVVSSVQGDATRLLLTLAVSGTATVASTAAGALTKQTTASATSSVVSATASSITNRTALSGTSAVVSAADGDVLRVGITYGISGTAAAVSTTSGDATRSLLTLPITGTTAVSSTTAGSITARAQIAGTSSTVSTVSGAATREPRTFPIGGTSPAQSAATGALTALLQGAGTSAVVSTTAAAQSLRAKIAGQNTLLTTSAGDIDATRVVLGTIPVLSVVAGDPVIYVAPSIPAYPGLPYPGTTWPSYGVEDVGGQVKVGSLAQKAPVMVYRSGTWKRAPVKVFKNSTWKETL